MKTFLKKTLCILLFTTISAPFSGKCQGDEDPDTPVPIDGGLSILVAAGVAYGAKKVHEHKRKKPVLKSNEHNQV